MMLHMRKELQDILGQARAICADFGAEMPVIEQGSRIEESLEKYRPTLTFYGLYNAGKSTLINALLSEDGREIAATAARPCTERITEYQLGDYQVFDTPGLDAPKEHERMSRRHVEETNIIVFVISTGGPVDEEATVRELVELWRSWRPVIVVLNDKNAGVEGRKTEAVAGIRKQLFDHLEAMSGERRIRDEIDFVLVSAKTGVTARERMAQAKGDEAKQALARRLYELSGVEELARLLLLRLSENGGEKVLKPTKNMMERVLLDSVQVLATQAEDGGQSVFVKMMQGMVRSVERDFVEASKIAIQLLRNVLAEELLAGMRVGRAIDLDVFFESYVAEVEAIVQQKAAEGYQKLEEQVIVLEEGLKGDGEIDLSGLGVFGGAWPMADEKGLYASPLEISPQQRREIARQIGDFFQSPQGQAMLRDGLKMLRGFGVPGIKGRWTTTLNRWAGNLGKGIGVGIQVLAVVYELNKAVEAQRAYEEEVRRREQDQVNTSQNLARQAEQKVVSHLPEVSVEVFGGIRAHFAGLEEELSQGAVQAKRAMEELEELLMRLEVLGGGYFA